MECSHCRCFCCSLPQQLLQGSPLGLAKVPLMQFNYTLLQATQQPKSGCQQKPRRPSCPDEPEMGVGWAKWSSSPLQSPKGTQLLPPRCQRERTEPTSVESSGCSLALEHEKEEHMPDAKEIQPDQSQWNRGLKLNQAQNGEFFRVFVLVHLFACFPLLLKTSK